MHPGRAETICRIRETAVPVERQEICEKDTFMPWYNGDYPPSYKNQPPVLREKAVEIANQLLGQGVDEGIAIATGLKRARLFFKKQEKASTEKNHTEAPPTGKEGK